MTRGMMKSRVQAGIEFKVATDAAERLAATQLILRVFHGELGLIGLQSDTFDDIATYCLAFYRGRLVAVVRLIPDSPAGLPLDSYIDLSRLRKVSSRLGEASRLAIAPEYRNQGIIFGGFPFVRATASSLGVSTLIINSLLRTMSLYERLGFLPFSDAFHDPSAARPNDPPGKPNVVAMKLDVDDGTSHE